MNVLNHLYTISKHKKLVLIGCFKLGLYKQGILHDLSKFSPTEFIVGCKYFQGNLSPNNIERIKVGYSLAWLHHKGRNRHHWEYWLDYGLKGEGIVGAKMPVKYVVEMFVDRVCAGKVYLKDEYTDASPYMYYQYGKDHQIMHKRTRKLLEKLLYMLKENGEEATFKYIKNNLLIKKKTRKRAKHNVG